MDRMRASKEFQFELAPNRSLSRLSNSESWRILELKEIFHLLFFKPDPFLLTHTHTPTHKTKPTLN